MKKYILSAFMFYIILFSLTHITASASDGNSEDSHRGIWFSYTDFEEAGLYNKTEAEFRKNANKVFKRIKKYDFNAIYFHVRPFDDAVYPSNEFKWCTYVSDEPLSYDPLAIMIEYAKLYDVEFHAWINPYRISHTKIYNPKKQKVTDRIVRGVMEIIQNYDVDGIHFDDYFYPSKRKGNQFFKVKKRERMDNINAMVSTVYQAIKSYDSDITFGISPAGGIAYAKSLGCDIKTWLQTDGYVDYIIPQIYWSNNYISGGKKVKLFEDTLFDWLDAGLGNTTLYSGLALYKTGYQSSIDRGWKKSRTNIQRQIKQSYKFGADGYVMFTYKSLLTPDGKKEMKFLKHQTAQ